MADVKPANGQTPTEPAIGKSSSGSGASGAADQTSKAKERLAFVFKVLIGYTVRVEVKSGIVYEGIYSSAVPEGDSLQVTLQFAKVLKDPSVKGDLPAARPQELLELDSADIVQITAQDVRIGAKDVGPLSEMDDAGGFGTDSAISRGRGGRENRELERWVPDESEMAQYQHLEQSVAAKAGWDQFALNESKFGVRTDYHEELYTTRLDPSKSKISVAEAARLAAEIERGNKSGANLHVLEERGVLVDDSQLDEEDRYGAVIRPTDMPQPKVGRPVIPPPPPPSASSSTSSLGSAANGGRSSAWGRGPPSAPIGIAVDARREANKVRAQMVVPKKASPYGTPKSPLASPLIGNAQKMEALNLEPGVPRVDETTRREFEQFKASTAAQQQQQPGKPSGMSVEEMKSFSQQVGSKLQRATSSDKKMDGGSAEKATKDEPAAAAGTTTPSSSGLKLNPNAKEFSFNINASEFKPTFTPPSSAGPTPPPAGSGGATPPNMRPGSYGGPPPGSGGMPRHTPPGSDGPHGDMRRQGGPSRGGMEYDDGYRRRDDRDDRRMRDDRQRQSYEHGMRPPPPPPDAMHPPPPPPGKGGHVGSPGSMHMGGVVPMMAPMMMMGPGGMPTGQAGFFMMPGGARPAGAMFMPAGGTPSYMPGRPVMVPMMAPGGVPMPPAVMGMGGYQMGPPGGPPPSYGGQQQQRQHMQHRNDDHKDQE